nr:MAG TPA: hypothetical protein [Microviridae sp.]
MTTLKYKRRASLYLFIIILIILNVIYLRSNHKKL